MMATSFGDHEISTFPDDCLGAGPVQAGQSLPIKAVKILNVRASFRWTGIERSPHIKVLTAVVLLHGASAAVQTGCLPGRWSGPGRPTNHSHGGAVGRRLPDRVRAAPTAPQQPIIPLMVLF